MLPMLCAPGGPGSPRPLLRPGRTGPKDALSSYVPRAPSGHWATTPRNCSGPSPDRIPAFPAAGGEKGQKPQART